MVGTAMEYPWKLSSYSIYQLFEHNTKIYRKSKYMTAHVSKISKDAHVVRDAKMAQKQIPKDIAPAKDTIIFDVAPINENFIFVKGKEPIVSNPFEIGIIPHYHKVGGPFIFFSHPNEVVRECIKLVLDDDDDLMVSSIIPGILSKQGITYPVLALSTRKPKQAIVGVAVIQKLKSQMKACKKQKKTKVSKVP